MAGVTVAALTIAGVLSGMGVSMNIPTGWTLLTTTQPLDKRRGTTAVFNPPRTPAAALMDGLIVESDPADGRSLMQYVQDTLAGEQHARLESRSFKVCPGMQPGWFVRIRDASGGPDVEYVFTIDRARGAAAAYSRTSGTVEDPAMHKALASLCLK